MANGDPFLVGMEPPPDNLATSATMLVHNGNPFGTQHTAFWVQRLGAPICNAAIRGDNFSSGPTRLGETRAGVLGMTDLGIGVLGAKSPRFPGFGGDIGVLGITDGFGVVGRSLFDTLEDDRGIIVSGIGVVGDCKGGIGVYGSSTSGWGVIGESTGRAGVTGKSVNGVGVEAQSKNSHGLQATTETGVGVFGFSRQGRAGVFGKSILSEGVVGESEQASGVVGVSPKNAVVGWSTGLGGASIGVVGFSDPGEGIHGESIKGTGVFGRSEKGEGVVGVSPKNAVVGWSTGTGGASIGVEGWSSAGAGVQGDSNTGIGVCGRSPNGLAGYFIGNVVVSGALYVAGGPKSAVVKHPDGTHRSLFCLESPESYFEDFGEVTLTGDSVVVKLDKDFAALVKRSKYQVFLTSYGPEMLYVRKRSSDGFEIARVDRSTGKKLPKISVGYRIVARRADLKLARLPKIKMPPKPKMTKPGPVSPKPKRPRAYRVAEFSKPEPLPSRPQIPSPDLLALAKAKPVKVKGKARRNRTQKGT